MMHRTIHRWKLLAVLAAGSWLLGACGPLGSDGPEHDPTQVRYNALCSGLTLGASASGQDVTLTASGSCDPSNEFLYWAYNGTSWTLLCSGWTTSTTCNWTAPSAGVYRFAVNTHNVGGPTDGRAETTLGVGGTATPQPCTASTVSVSGTEPSLTVNASATCGGSTAEYRYWIGGNNTWTRICDWTTATSCAWNSTALPSGPYRVVLEARAQNSFEGVQTRSEVVYNIGGGGPCSTTNVSLSANTGPAGASVTITASATCGGSSTPEFAYWVRSPAGVWTLLQLWTTGTTANWNTSGLAEGAWSVVVTTRQVGVSGEDSRATAPYTVTAGTAGCSGLSFSLSPTSTASAGATVTYTASASCNGATATYAYWVRDAGGSWSYICPWGTSASCNWNTTGFAAGTYSVVVTMREQGTFVEKERSTVSYTLTTPVP